ncbi:MAG: acyltransferase, partial [bacterium]|nr:acyltransferase [bacterium]
MSNKKRTCGEPVEPSVVSEVEPSVVSEVEPSVVSEVEPSVVSEVEPYFAAPTAIIEDGAVIGEGTKIWHFSHVMKGAIIGRDCKIGKYVSIESNVVIGSNVKIQNHVNIFEGVTLEDDVFVGPSATFTNVMKPRSARPKRKEDYPKTLAKKGATIGAGAKIICGATIGRYAFIGAGAVVTKDVPDYGLVLGVPAKHVGWVCECGERLTQGFRVLENLSL